MGSKGFAVMRAVLSSNPPSLIQFSYATSLPHQHHDPLLPQQFWNRLNHQRSSSKTEITMQPSCFSNSPPMMKPIWEDSWKDHCTLHIEITLNKICSKYNIYNCFLGIYKQRKWQMRKKERKKKKKSLKEKSLPNYEFKWKHDFPTYPCVCIYIMQWMHSVVQLKLYFLPTNEQHEDISLHITYVLIIKANKEGRNECIALHDHQLIKKLLFYAYMFATQCAYLALECISRTPSQCSIHQCLCSFIKTKYSSVML